MQVDWSKAPDWANWHAYDRTGRGYWYSTEPIYVGAYDCFLIKTGKACKSQYKKESNFIGWIASMRERPTQTTTTQDTTQQILSERGSRYGKFSDLSSIDQELKSVMHQAPNWGSLKPHHKTALEMIQHKVSRILNGDPDYDDNWIDIEGYSRLGREPNQ